MKTKWFALVFVVVMVALLLMVLPVLADGCTEEGCGGGAIYVPRPPCPECAAPTPVWYPVPIITSAPTATPVCREGGICRPVYPRSPRQTPPPSAARPTPVWYPPLAQAWPVMTYDVSAWTPRGGQISR